MKTYITTIILCLIPLFAQGQVMMKAISSSAKIGDEPYTKWTKCSIPIRIDIEKNEIKIYATNEPIIINITAIVKEEKTEKKKTYIYDGVDNKGNECSIMFDFEEIKDGEELIFLSIGYLELNMAFDYILEYQN